MADRLELSERGVALILRDLREAGYVTSRREGRRVLYSVVAEKPMRRDPLRAPNGGSAARTARRRGDFPAEGHSGQFPRLSGHPRDERLLSARRGGVVAPTTDNGWRLGSCRVSWPSTPCGKRSPGPYVTQ